MKTGIKLLALATMITLWSCSTSSDDNPSPSSSNNKVDQVSGEWTVSHYYDSGKDETHNYSGYSFIFSMNGSLQARSGSGNFTGSWRIGNQSSDDDSSSNRLVISIAGNKQMEDLSDDWVIAGISGNEISLKDDNPESMEELKFFRKNQ